MIMYTHFNSNEDGMVNSHMIVFELEDTLTSNYANGFYTYIPEKSHLSAFSKSLHI